MSLRENVQRLYQTVKKLILGFIEPEINYYAASLSFYTIFAFIPLLFIVLSVTTRLPGFDDHFGELQSFILGNLIPANVDAVHAFLEMFVNDIGRLGMTGGVYVAVTSIFFFKNYQHIACRIFRSTPRDFWGSITTYWTMISLVPMGMAGSLYFTTKAQIALQSSEYTRNLDITLLMPYLIVWLSFFIIFKISANTPLPNRRLLWSALATSIAWNITKEAFVMYAVMNKAYASIYGSFSIVLLFFLWIYISWIVLLYGMRLCAGEWQEETVTGVLRETSES